jgi:protein phosphatase
VLQGDALVICSDGLYNTLSDGEMEEIVRGQDAPSACRDLIDSANRRGTPDNLTAAVVRFVRPVSSPPEPRGAGGLPNPLQSMLATALRRWRSR